MDEFFSFFPALCSQIAVYTVIGHTTKHSRKILPKEMIIEELDMGEYVTPQFKPSRQKNMQLVHNGYVYCRDSNRGLRV
jgi:hypothetical protein